MAQWSRRQPLYPHLNPVRGITRRVRKSQRQPALPPASEARSKKTTANLCSYSISLLINTWLVQFIMPEFLQECKKGILDLTLIWLLAYTVNTESRSGLYSVLLGLCPQDQGALRCYCSSEVTATVTVPITQSSRNLTVH